MKSLHFEQSTPQNAIRFLITASPNLEAFLRSGERGVLQSYDRGLADPVLGFDSADRFREVRPDPHIRNLPESSSFSYPAGRSPWPPGRFGTGKKQHYCGGNNAVSFPFILFFSFSRAVSRNEGARSLPLFLPFPSVPFPPVPGSAGSSAGSYACPAEQNR